MTGFWERYGAPSNVDWCEPNYLHSAYVAEWWNTLSSVPIFLLALVMLARSLSPRWRGEPRFAIASIAVAIVGLGSVAFHATLLRSAQAADELPMIFSGLAFTYALLARDVRVRPRLALGLVVYAVAFTAVYYWLSELFVFFALSYAAVVAFIALRTGHLSLFAAAEKGRRKWFIVAFGAYIGGFATLWVPEHVLLTCDHALQSLELHALFHLTSAVGSCAWIAWALHDRATLSRADGP